MIRAFVVAVLIFINVSGCEAMAEAAREQQAQRQAQVDDLRERIAELTPEQKDNVQKCASTATGRINALRMVGTQQGAMGQIAASQYTGMNDFAVVSNCLNNPYYYETIPQPPTPVIVNSPYNGPTNCTTVAMGGGMSTTNCN